MTNKSFMQQQPIVYHNPQCSKSRLVLEIIKGQGYQPEIIEYMTSPLTNETFESFFSQIAPAELIRTDDALFKELDLSLTDKNLLLNALRAYPQLLQRPIVVFKSKIIIARPPARVLEILDEANA